MIMRGFFVLILACSVTLCPTQGHTQNDKWEELTDLMTAHYEQGNHERAMLFAAQALSVADSDCPYQFNRLRYFRLMDEFN